MSHLLRPIAGAALAVAAIAAPAVASPAHHSRNHTAAVFVQTDNPAGNSILAYSRARTGTLTYTATYATDGDGAVAVDAVADPLASQGSLVTADGGRLLIAVNAGTDTVSVFQVDGTRLRLRQTVASDGAFPASVAVHRDLVYVLNAGGEGSVAGFRIRGGRLHPISDSLRTLALGNLTPPNFLASPGQVGFTPNGRQLVVTTKLSTGSLDVFGVGPRGRLSTAPTVTTSATPVPFAFVFGPGGKLVAAEAGASSISTYRLSASGAATVIGSLTDGQKALCWITAARGYYYVSNAGSNTISAFTVNAAGAPVLVGVVGTAEGGPTDSASAANGHFLYVENGGAGTVDEFAVGAGGTLTKLGVVTALPTAIEGIATVG